MHKAKHEEAVDHLVVAFRPETPDAGHPCLRPRVVPLCTPVR